MKSIEEAEQTSMRLQAEEDKREKMKLRNKLQEQSTNSGRYLQLHTVLY